MWFCSGYSASVCRGFCYLRSRTRTAALSQDSDEDRGTCVHAYKVLIRLRCSYFGPNKCDAFTFSTKHYIKQVSPGYLTDLPCFTRSGSEAATKGQNGHWLTSQSSRYLTVGKHSDLSESPQVLLRRDGHGSPQPAGLRGHGRW